jgi:hypothetical protein
MNVDEALAIAEEVGEEFGEPTEREDALLLLAAEVIELRAAAIEVDRAWQGAPGVSRAMREAMRRLARALVGQRN